ncbi:MAG: ABC transporter ATP-binding protein, partial [Acidobacteria bacterium]|nr:ABC transporter ATP-binding protein [Acidobacteriota bacterium]
MNEVATGNGAGRQNEPAIRLDRLTKRYGDFVAVDGMTLEVPRGRLFGFLGPNGA